MLRTSGDGATGDAPDSSSGELKALVGSSPTPRIKTCKDCGRSLPLDKFSLNGKRKDGTVRHRRQCKSCVAERSRRWYEENRERNLKTQAEWREKNRDHILEYKREYYAEVRADPVAYRALLDRQAQLRAKYRRERPELFRGYHKAYRERRRKDPERHARFLANQRMKAEAKRRHGDAIGGYSEVAFELVDAREFKEWLRDQRSAGRSMEMVAKGSGVAARSLRRILDDDQAKVKLDIADRVLMANGLMLWELGY